MRECRKVCSILSACARHRLHLIANEFAHRKLGDVGAATVGDWEVIVYRIADTTMYINQTGAVSRIYRVGV